MIDYSPLSAATSAPRNLVLVLVEDHPKAILLLRTARARARERNGKWRHACIAGWAEERGVVGCSADARKKDHTPVNEDDSEHGLPDCLRGEQCQRLFFFLTALTYFWDVFVRASTFSRGNCHQLRAAVINSSQDEGLSEAIDSVSERARICPIAETDIISSDGACVA